MISGRVGGPERAAGIGAEAARFRNLADRWIGFHLNRLFSLTGAGARYRRLRIAILILAFGLMILGAHVLLRRDVWVGSGTRIATTPFGPLALTSVLRMVLIVGICSTIGIHIAGDFLADVFELEDTGVAQKYIRDVAFGTGNDVLHLGGGRIPERGAKSPMILIGGPGRVQVEFDTAALFEKPDGTPHVVGPRPSGPVRTRHAESEFHLEGFERLREPLINLRDQYIGSASGEPMVVTGRSLDGLPISVADVRGVFSVRRADGGVETEASIDQPYPFRPRDIENLIYRQSVPVMTGGAEPSGLPGQWAQVMQDLIEAALREFMSQNRFAEYFAGVGARELELSEFLQDTILSRSLQISKDTAEPVAPDPQTESGFRPRTDLSRSFRKYSSEFSLKAQEHGLELHWIGVGTWKMPDENAGLVVNDKHLEAWRDPNAGPADQIRIPFLSLKKLKAMNTAKAKAREIVKLAAGSIPAGRFLIE